MSNYSVISRGVTSCDKLITNQLVLNGVETSRIVQDLEDTEATQSSLVTFGAVSKFNNKISQIISDLDPSSVHYQDQTVMTVSVVDRFFSKRDQWILANWDIVDNVLYGLAGSAENECRVNNTAFAKPGTYFISITVSSIPSGMLRFYINDKNLQDIETPGHYGFEVDITDIYNDKLKLVSVNLNPEERVVVSSWGIYFIAPRFYEYLLNKITSLATVDANNFVTKTMFREEMEKYIGQFEASAGMFTAKLEEHLNADNPHGITLEKLGGAKLDHEHNQYVTITNFNETLARELQKYAPVKHFHEEYVTAEELPELVKNEVGDLFNTILTIPPAIIVQGPQGKLPTRFMRTEISLPVPLLLPSQLNTDVYGNFSSVYGIITTNCEDMISTVMKVFLNGDNGADLPANYNYQTPLIIRNQFHTHRLIKGYKLWSRDGKVTRWKVFTGNNTFQHQIDELTEDNEYYFDEPIYTDSIAFAIMAIEQFVYGFKIKLILSDENLDMIRITRKSFSLSVPDSGANRLVKLSEVDAERFLEVDKIADGLPYYVMGEYSGESLGFYGTYTRPEYGESRTGVEVYTDKYEQLEPDADSSYESYTHTVLGKLSLLEGTSRADRKLPVIYNKANTSWITTPETTKVVIEQEVVGDYMVLCGYTLNWRESDLFRIPTTWTLMVKGVDMLGQEKTVVVDSIEDFFPCYSVEDDDIIYSKTIKLDMHVKQLTLTMLAPDGSTDGLALNQFIPYFSENFYCIPENTMYHGINKSSSLCLGYLTHNSVSGWVPTNLCLGKAVTLPVNDLDEVGASTVHVVPNPFLSTNVTVTVNPYRWVDEQPASAVGQVLSVTATEIKIVTLTPAVYTVTVARSW